LTDYDTRIFGHLGQIAPAHIVITSPQFDSREIICGGQGGRRHTGRYETAPIDKIIAMRKAGLSYDKIAAELGLAANSIKGWYKRATKELEDK